MNGKTKLAELIFALALVACNDGASDPSNDVQEIDGMIFLRGGSITLGSNDSKYRASERPAMKVNLDYSFYLAAHEMTCGEYRTLAKKQKLNDFGKCENDSLPLANITYFDAILAANAKSKSEKYDTAYTYSKASFDSEKHCTNLEGLIFHPDVEAYRLPTEAEWVFAASQDWDPQNNSWNADNSNYKSHVVCSAKKDKLGFCDLAGNVKEWVNDWAGHFHDTTITNYVGAFDGGDLGERVLKGGYYSDRASEMNFIARGDEYTVEGSTHADRIGFRLAFGSIPSPTWLDASGKVQESAIFAIASTSSLKKYTGSYDMILAFRNDISGNLTYIDYKEGNLSVKEIRDTIKSYHPEISPDGKRIAFCTKPEGISGTSKLYVRDLNDKGSNLVRLDVKSAAIPRWRVLDNGDTTIVYVTDAGNNKDTVAFKKTSTWEVRFANGKFGTPKKLFDGAYHGGISNDNRLAVTGARLLRARIAKSGSTITEKARDTTWYNSEQACNASLAQDGSKRTLFLDFASKTGKKFVGENYTTHERILIADSNGKLKQSIKAPSGSTFDHSEWTTDGELSNIVATLTNANGAHTKIALISPKDSSILELAEGEEIWHPNLWVAHKKQSSESDSSENDFELDPDSAGIYYNNSGACSQAQAYRYKMETLWQYKDTTNIAIMGSSRALYGIAPLKFSKPFFAINLATPAAALYGTSTYFYNYVLPHVKNLKVLVLSLDLDRSYIVGLNANNMFYNAYNSYPGYVYDKNHNYWVDKFPKKLVEATYNSPGTKAESHYRPTRGHLSTSSEGWGEPTITEDSCWMDSKRDSYLHNLELLENLLDTCKAHGITLIGVIHPINPQYAETGAFGYAGLRRSEVPAVMDDLKKMTSTYKNFILMDENKMGKHDYTDDDAHDYSHLSQTGAEKLTHRIDSLIKTLDIDLNNTKKK